MSSHASTIPYPVYILSGHFLFLLIVDLFTTATHCMVSIAVAITNNGIIPASILS